MTLPNNHSGRCDGLHRRELLQMGAAALCGLTLADFLRADARSSLDPGYRKRSIVNVWLAGGASHLDTFDMKPDAPAEIRGEFKPIATKVLGVRICEHLPRIAARMDRIALIRSLTGTVDSHDGAMCATGYPPGSMKNIGGRPNIGSVVSKLQGPTNGNVPTAVAMISDYNASEQAYSRSAGFLGPTFDCYSPDTAAGRANLTLRNVTVARLEDRMKLQASFDSMRRDLDTRGSMQAMDAYTRRAVQFVTSREFAQALDLTREPDRVRSRYGIGIGPTKKLGLQNARFLLARRLIECGARCVNLTWEEGGERRWDTHSKNFAALRDELLPPFDVGLSAFLDDLEARGMLDDVLVLVWGEFGRTPRINNNAGRDHYAPAASALLFGGGLKAGQVIGSTNRYGERPQDRPIHYQQMFATLYRHLGIDPAQATILDPNNRPQYLIEHTDTIRELVG